MEEEFLHQEAAWQTGEAFQHGLLNPALVQVDGLEQELVLVLQEVLVNQVVPPGKEFPLQEVEDQVLHLLLPRLLGQSITLIIIIISNMQRKYLTSEF